MPKISVIVPIFGVEKYIERCARSLFEQTLDDIEYLFIDDCTPDKSMDVLESLIEEYRIRLTAEKKTVKIERMPTNSGQASVRRHAIQLATGDYIIHCDSDDWVDTDMYRLMYETAAKENVDIVWCDYYKSDGVTREYDSQENQPELMLGPLWNKLVKRTLYTKNTIIYPTANKAEDGTLMVQLSYYSKSRSYINKALYYYFCNVDSICRVKTEAACLSRYKQEVENTNLMVSFLENNGIAKKYHSDSLRWKNTARDNLLPLIGRSEYYKLWINTYPEINLRFILSRNIPFRNKIGFLARILGLHNRKDRI